MPDSSVQMKSLASIGTDTESAATHDHGRSLLQALSTAGFADRAGDDHNEEGRSAAKRGVIRIALVVTRSSGAEPLFRRSDGFLWIEPALHAKPPGLVKKTRAVG